MNKLQSLVISLFAGLLVAGLVFAFTGPGSNQAPNGSPTFWQISGSNVNFTTGNVGIGTSSPSYPLVVQGNSAGAAAEIAGNASAVPSNFIFIVHKGGDINTQYLRVQNDGTVGIGTVSPNASALLDITSTAKGFLGPRMTTTQRDAITTPAAGLLVYNSTLNEYDLYNGTSWTAIGSGGGGGGGGAQSQLFTSSGTFTVPSGVTRVYVTAVGGGGGGGGGSYTGLGGGGGAGGIAIVKEPVTVTSGANITVTIGAGGAGGAGANGAAANGTDGTDTTFGALLTASGGGGGGGSGVTSVSDNVNGGNGGAYPRGSQNFGPGYHGVGSWGAPAGGGGGGNGGYAAYGGGGAGGAAPTAGESGGRYGTSSFVSISGAVGFWGTGGGGGAGSPSHQNGYDGTGYGAGGGGGAAIANPSGNGGVGTAGFLLVEWSQTGSPGTPGGSNTQVQFNNAGSLGGSANFVWDYTNNRLGIGTASPAQSLSVAGTIESTSGGFKFPDGTTQTTATSGGGVPSTYSILGDSATAPSGYTYTGNTVKSNDYWETLAPEPTGRAEPGGDAVNGIIYVMGGGSAGTSNDAYDTAANSWTSKAAVTTARFCTPMAVAVGTTIYLIGGATSGCAAALTTNEAYDTVANTWSSKLAMTTARGRGTAVAVSGIVYVIGGAIPYPNATTANEAYNPSTNTWSSKLAMPTCRADSYHGVVSGIIYVIGGRNCGNTAYLTTNEAYDPVANTWSTKAAFDVTITDGVYGGSGTAANNKIYVIDGVTAGDVTRPMIEEYDPSTNKWNGRVQYIDGLGLGNLGVSVNNIIYVIAGTTGFVNAYHPSKVLYYIHKKN